MTVTAKLNTAVRKTLADPATVKRLADIGQQLPPSDRQSAEALATYQSDEIARWWPVIRGANIKAE
jgi:tripartite-type tricarboxylate transporter receptor subunit TctC